MRLIDRTFVAFSYVLSISPLPVARKIVIRTTLLQSHQLHSDRDQFDTVQLTLPQLLNEHSSGKAHATVIKNGAFQQLDVSNYLMSLYVKSTKLTSAHRLFDEIPERDVRSWTILISGFSRNGSYKLALDLFRQMQKHGITPNQFTFSIVLKCCGRANELNMGKTILGWIMRNGVCLDMTMQNSVLDFYVKCKAFGYARKFFELMSVKDTVSWNIMISAYLKNGDIEKAEELFWRLPTKNAASWNTIIDGYLQDECQQSALQLLYQMVATGPAFTHVTFSIALILASSLHHVELGRQIHGQLLRVGIHDAFIKNSLIDMYCKCGKMEWASIVYKASHLSVVRPQKIKHSHDESLANSVTLSSMISGYIQNDRIEDALNVFSLTVSKQGEVDKFTLASVLSACADAGLLELGQLIHTYILKTGNEPDVFINSSMIDMYAKCGRLKCARSIFEEAKVRNVVLWTAIISSYASHGEGGETVRLFELMQKEGIIPNEVTFVGILTACSHAGLINEGCNYFMLMKDTYAIEPKVEHYTCMVDLLGRAGRLNEIKTFIGENNISHLSAVWEAFLSSCHLHKNIEMARWVSEKLYELEPLAAGPYVLMSKTCATDFRWEEAAMLKARMQERGIKKQPGQSWIR